MNTTSLPGFAVRRCLRTHHVSSSCMACIRACPQEALSLREQRLILTPVRCSGCGACTAVCPQDALLAPPPFPPEAEAAVTVAARNGTVLFVERDAALPPETAGTVVRVPALESVPASLLLHAAARGAERIGLLSATRETERRTLAERIALVRRILKDLDCAADVRILFSPALESAGRRLWLRGLVRRLEDDGKAGGERNGLSPERLKALREEPSVRVPESRRLLLDALRRLRRAARPGAGTAESPAAAALFATVNVDAARCVKCGLCAVVCPTGALEASGPPGESRLQASTEKCTGCRLCTDICFARALELAPARSLAEILDAEPHAVGPHGAEAETDAQAVNAFGEWEEKLGAMIDAPIYRT